MRNHEKHCYSIGANGFRCLWQTVKCICRGRYAKRSMCFSILSEKKSKKILAQHGETEICWPSEMCSWRNCTSTV